eukprot:13483993-Alexandrium_andersonii.AAC.1
MAIVRAESAASSGLTLGLALVPLFGQGRDSAPGHDFREPSWPPGPCDRVNHCEEVLDVGLGDEEEAQ